MNLDGGEIYKKFMDEGKLMQFMIKHQKSLQYEIDYLKTQLKDHDTGHIRTAISVLEERVAEIQKYIDSVHDMIIRAQAVLG
jgi:hypothetical protein